MPLVPVVVAVLGAAAAAAIARMLAKEWQRVNAELHSADATVAESVERDNLPTLKRDPRTGVYRAD